MIGLFGCSGKTPESIGVIDDRLAPCPASPTCVSSDADDDDHRIAALRLTGDPAAVWEALKAELSGLPGTTIITASDHYLHAEAKSRVFGFVDDVEFHLRPAASVMAARSASRVGKYDFGVNAERIEAIRKLLQARGLVSG